MDKREIQITNKDLIKPKHKNEHEPYEYFKYEVTKRNKDSQCYVAIYEIPPQKANYPDIAYYPNSNKVGIILNGESSTFYEKNAQVDYYQGE